MMISSDLPHDLIEEILSRVSVTSLRRLRSTCKRWYRHALFKDPVFIKNYFDKTARQYHAFMLIDFSVCSMSSIPHILRGHMTKAGITLKIPHHNLLVNVTQAFHCDGILLCTPKPDMLVVWDPFLMKTRWIQPQKHHRATYALGYDNKELCHNYKILRYPCYYGNLKSWKKLDVTPEGGIKLEIYEFSSNSWRNLDAVYEFSSSNSWRNLDAITPEAYLKPCGVSLKGNTYWVSYQKGDKDDYSLLCFDFSTERFHRLCVPFHHQPCSFDTMALSVFGEDQHLSLLYQSKETLKVDIWLTDEIETTFVSWSKFLTVDLKPTLYCFWDPVSFFIIDKEKKVVLSCHGEKEYCAGFNMVWMVGEEEYRVTSGLSVRSGISRWSLGSMTPFVPRLFGYVPKLAL